ncbi:MAG: acyl-CoA dehydrogenase [Gammaproteobacteria bacterium]|nr:acyl-CoA dehydrogenase [Gammaproteobacteria bacterium]
MKESGVPAEGERRTRVHTDILAPGPAQAMLGLLDRDPRAISEGDPLPLGWHWLYFRQPVRASRLARDGHEVRGDFMPDIDLPRRMWAGGTLRSPRPVALGEPAELRSEILSVTEKRGKSGRLVFVTVGHTVLQRDRRCVEEEQVIVYREAAPRPAAATARPQAGRQKAAAPGRGGGTAVAAGADDMAGGSGGHADPTPEWTESFLPTTVILFQFSALTYNGHRIHYDHPYVTKHEGYPGLLVHGPLTALLLLEAAQRHSPRPVRQFRCRALAPLFVDHPITLAGQAAPAGADGSGPQQERIVEALAPSGAVAMRGWVT